MSKTKIQEQYSPMMLSTQNEEGEAHPILSIMTDN